MISEFWCDVILGCCAFVGVCVLVWMCFIVREMNKLIDAQRNRIKLLEDPDYDKKVLERRKRNDK